MTSPEDFNVPFTPEQVDLSIVYTLARITKEMPNPHPALVLELGRLVYIKTLQDKEK